MTVFSLASCIIDPDHIASLRPTSAGGYGFGESNHEPESSTMKSAKSDAAHDV